MRLLQDSAADKLSEVEARLRGLREEKRRARQVAEAAKAAAAAVPDGHDDGPQMEAARSAVEAVKAVDAEIEKTQEDQVGLLKTAGQPLAYSSIGDDGWAIAARRLNLAKGELRADVPALSLLTQAPVRPAPSEPPPPAVGAGLGSAQTSNRWLYPVIAVEPFSGIEELTATDFTVVPTSTDAVTGVEIEPATDTEKAKLPVNVALASPTAKTYAVVAEGVPAKVFDTRVAAQAFLGREMARHLSEAVDAAVVSAIEAAAPPSDQTGADLVAQIRNAIASARDLGGEPTVLALTPQDAAGLDLTQDGAGNYVFTLRLAGSATPVWSLVVREVPTISAPTLIDPATLGLIYAGPGSVLVDPYSSMERNLVRVRAEVDLVPHVRNVVQGAFTISA